MECRVSWDPVAGDRAALSGPAALLRRLLSEPALRNVDPDASEFTLAHRRLLQSKPLVRALFERFYRRCRSADEKYFAESPGSLRIELGSGAGLLKDIFPDVYTSDVKFLPFVDLIARSEELPFADASVRAIYAMNVLHHVAEPRTFFREMTRVLAPGGGVVMIEPYYGPVARLVFERLFTSEVYKPDAEGWPSHSRDQPASGANAALSYIILRRDHELWAREFPELELIRDEPHTQLTYVASGGLNFRQLVPTRMGGAIALIERALAPLDRWIALQHTLVVRRRVSG
jgi:SAM-dependent methyltransferase